jgi:hypothetical protein
LIYFHQTKPISFIFRQPNASATCLKESQNQYKSTTYQAFLKLYQYIVAELSMNMLIL